MDFVLSKRISQIVDNVNIYDVLDLFDVENSRNDDMHIYCPLHYETRPSFKVYYEPDRKRQSFYCFSCQKGGDVLRLYELIKQRDNPGYKRGMAIRDIERDFNLPEPKTDATLYQDAFNKAMNKFKYNEDKSDESAVKTAFYAAQTLATATIKEVLEYADIEPSLIDEKVWVVLDDIYHSELPNKEKRDKIILFADTIVKTIQDFTKGG